MVRNIILFFICTLYLQKVYSQINIQEVVIQENRLSNKKLKVYNANKIVITDKEIQDLHIKNIAELLQFATGVQINRRGNNNAQTDIKINGGTFEQTLILVDGHPILDPQTGHHFMNLPISINDIEQIEILTSPQAHTYGINGISGTINIVTKRSASNTVEINALHATNFLKDSATQKIYNTTNVQAGFQHVSKYFKQYFSASTDIGNGYMHNTDTRNYKLLYTNDMNIFHNNKLSILLSYINNEFGANGFYAFPYDANSFEKVQTFFGAARHEKRISNRIVTKTNFSARVNNDYYVFKKDNPNYYYNYHRTQSYFFNTNLTYQYKIGETALGIFTNNQKIESTNLDTFKRNNQGIYIQNAIKISKKLDANFGLFATQNNKWGFNILPGIDFGYQATKNIKMFVALGTANRIPTYTDLYYKGPSNVGNDLLLPEKSLGFDMGIKYNDKRLHTSLTGFVRRVNDLIDWTKNADSTIWKPSNFGTQIVKGVNFQSTYIPQNISENFTLDNITLNYQYLYINVTNQISNEISKYSLDYFKHQLMIYGTFNLLKNLYASPSVRYQSRFNFNDYTIASCRIGFNTKYASIYTDIDNILNTEYLEANASPMPKRWISLGFRLKMPYNM